MTSVLNCESFALFYAKCKINRIQVLHPRNSLNEPKSVFANPISHTFRTTRNEQSAVTVNLNLSAQKTRSRAKSVRNRVYKNTLLAIYVMQHFASSSVF